MARQIDLDQLMKYPLRRGSEHCDEKNADPRFLNGVESILEWAQTLPTLTPPNEWVSVEERLPKYNIREDGELISSKILCYCETDKTVHLVVSQKFYTGRKGEIVRPVFRYYDEWGDEIENVSHWMPLPAPPKKERDHE